MLITTTSVAVRSLLPAPAANLTSPTPTPAPQGDRLIAAASQGAAALCKAQGSADISPATQAALEKLSNLLEQASIAGESIITSMAVKAAHEDAKNIGEKIAKAEGDVKSHHQDQRMHTKRKIKAMEERIAAKKKQGFWGSIAKVFKFVAAAASVVGAAFSSGTTLVILAAILSSASAITSLSSNPLMQKISLGLAIAATVANLCNLCSSLGSTAGKAGEAGAQAAAEAGKAGSDAARSGIITAIKTASKWTEVAAHCGEAGSTCASKLAGADVMDAEADKMSHATAADKTKQDAAESTTEVQDIRELLSKTFQQLQAVVSAEHNALSAAA